MLVLQCCLYSENTPAEALGGCLLSHQVSRYCARVCKHEDLVLFQLSKAKAERESKIERRKTAMICVSDQYAFSIWVQAILLPLLRSRYFRNGQCRGLRRITFS